jgi:hypothetical protein
MLLIVLANFFVTFSRIAFNNILLIIVIMNSNDNYIFKTLCVDVRRERNCRLISSYTVHPFASIYIMEPA